MGLEEYRARRDFTRTPEPAPRRGKRPRKGPRTFVVHKHGTRSLHYDLRLEFGGALMSWAVPRGPSLDPGTRRLAVRVEDHPIDYGSFEGVIPPGEYGAGPVMVWDAGEWVPKKPVTKALRDGDLTFELRGSKLRGEWHLVRAPRGYGGGSGDGHDNWLLIKRRDAYAKPPDYDVLEDRPESVLSGRTLEEIASAGDRDPGARPTADDRPDGAEKRSRVRVAARGAGKRSVGGAPSTARRRNPGRSPAGASNTSTRSRGRRTGAGARIPGSRRGSLPSSLTPELPTLVERAPEGDGWLHELKYDGYRLLCRIDRGRVRLLTRSGKDWTARFPGIAKAAASLPLERALLDGEAVVLRPDGTSDFQAMQNVLEGVSAGTIVYMAFDLLHLDGRDLRPAPLLVRKEALEALLASADAGDGLSTAGGDVPTAGSDAPAANGGAGAIRYSDHVVGHGPEVFREACRLGAEGIVCKRADRPYREGRTRDWLKVKCRSEQEFVIVGWTDPKGSRTGLGALLLGYYEDGELRYAGRVGTGFTTASLRALHGRLARIERGKPPVANPPRGPDRGVHWAAPRLVCEVAFTEWTRDGQLRHPVFRGLRADRAPKDVRREVPAPAADSDGNGATASDGATVMERETGREPRKTSGGASPSPRRAAAAGQPPRASRRRRSGRTAAARAAAPVVAGIRLTTADRVYYPELGVTKRELVAYYEAVADAFLMYAADRPLTLVRCPDGRQGECFYQKHVMPGFPPAILRIPIREKSGTRKYFAVSDLAGIVYLVQIGSLEFHAWGARRDRVDRPDTLIFDLDPGPGVPWRAVVDAAHLLRDRLGELGLRSFAKSTGGKGLHVVAPLVRRQGWDELRDFAHAIASGVARSDPSRFTDQASKGERRGRIYVDYLRNARGATAIVPFSTRAREGAPVSVPLAWEEVTPRLDPARFDVRSVPGIVSERLEAWADYPRVRQAITAAMKRAVGAPA